MLASVRIMFVALALTAGRIDGKPISKNGNRLQETLLLSPTLFPILFVALYCFLGKQHKAVDISNGPRFA
jgi:hypothetical protein